MSFLLSMERYLIIPYGEDIIDEYFKNFEDSNFFNDIKNGELLHIVNSVESEKFFKSLDSTLKLDESLTKSVKSASNLSDKENFVKLLFMGIASLESFVASNWTGPDISSESFCVSWLLNLSDQSSDSALRNAINNCLAVDGEGCCFIKHSELLLLALVSLQICSSHISSLYLTCKWWYMRCLIIQQQVLLEHSPDIHSNLMALIDDMSSNELLKCNTLFRLESARILLFYGYVTKSRSHIDEVLAITKMKVELVGAMGKRTYHQQRAVAQLRLDITIDNDVEEEEITMIGLPCDVTLEDEVRLHQIKFNDEVEQPNGIKSSLHQAILMSMFIQTFKSQPQDKLADEELMPYLTCLLSQPRCWAIQTSALFLRCHMESNHRRTVERSMMQLESLITSINGDRCDRVSRLHYIYCSYLPSRWALEAHLASTLISLGAFNSALDIFIRLEKYGEIINCYNMLKLRHKAAEIIEQRLALEPDNITMWCLLGDATDNVNCYEKAWTLSKEKSARSQRQWGLYHFNKKEYSESIPHFELSVARNNLQPNVWFMLGFSAMEQEDWKLSAKAYRRYCEINVESFEAWNNLAKAYIKLGEKSRAFKTLQEAVKCNYESWQVWDNLLAVSCDCGEFEEVILAYHRLLDLKNKHIDVEVLKILVRVVVDETPDVRGVPAGRLRKAALALFGRLTSQVTTSSILWQLYAQLTSSIPDQTLGTLTRIAHFLQQAHRAANQTTSWEKEVELSDEVMTLTYNLAQAYLICSEQSSNKKQPLTSAKFSLQSVITKVKNQQLEGINTHILNQLEKTLQEITNKLLGLQQNFV